MKTGGGHITLAQAKGILEAVKTANEPTDAEKALDYYRSAVENRAPKWVPTRIRVPMTVESDSPLGVDWPKIVAPPGDYDCHSNKWGAVSIEIDGRQLGIKPKEFEVIEWRERNTKQTT